MSAQTNPLIDDGLIDFLLYDVLNAESLCELEAYEHHSKETFDLLAGAWRPALDVAPDHGDIRSLFESDDAEGRFAWALMGGTLAYAAALVPEISGDIVNVDRAMRWGFAWKQGPFELLDALDPAAVITRL